MRGKQLSTVLLQQLITLIDAFASDQQKMSDPVKDQIAQEKFGKNFDELDSMQRIQVGGTKGGQARKEQMAEEHGGDVHAAYAEMGSKGGESRKEQMAEEHDGDASAGYAEMGQKGGQA